LKVSGKTSNPPPSSRARFRHRRLDRGLVANRSGPRRHCEYRSSVLDSAHKTGKGRCLGIEQDRYALDPGSDLRQHLQPFAGHRRVVIGEAGDRAAGVGQALDEALADRVGDDHENDRDVGSPSQRLDGLAAVGHQYVRIERDQFRRVALEEPAIAAGPAPVYSQIAVLVPIERSSPCKKAAVSVWEIGLFSLPMSTPRRRNRSRSCACTVKGHPTAVPPIIATKLRRLIR